MSAYRPKPEAPFIRRAAPWKRPDGRGFVLAFAVVGTLGGIALLALYTLAFALEMPLPRAPLGLLVAATLVLFLGHRPMRQRGPHPATLGLLAIVASACFLPGCASLDGAKIASNTSKDALDAAQPIVHERCTKYALDALERVRAMPLGDERERAAAAARAELDERRCPEIWTAYDDLRVARVALIAVITATEAGQCVGVSSSVSHCNAAGAIVDVVKASSAVATAVKEHRK